MREEENLHVIFMDLEELMTNYLDIWFGGVLEKTECPKRSYFEIIKDMYEVVVTSVRTTIRETSEFLVIIALHQVFFTLIKDKLTTHI